MDNVPMKKCKYCQSDIPVNAKICPNCRKKQKKPMGCLIAIIAVVIIGVAGAAAGSGGSKDESSSEGNVKISKNASAAENTSSDESSGDTKSGVVELGDSFETGGLKIDFTKCELDFKVSDDKYELYKPAEGKKYISVSFKFENTGDDDKYVSVSDFDCYADNETCEQKIISKVSDFINTNLSKGRTVSFDVIYEVPKDAKEIELEYEADFWTDEKVIIKVQ